MVWLTLIVYKNVWVAYTYGANVKLKSHNAFHNASHMRYQSLAMKKTLTTGVSIPLHIKILNMTKVAMVICFLFTKKTHS